MHGPDIPQIEVQQSMARIREAASKTQEAPAKILNKELALDLPAEFKIKLFPFRFFLDIFDQFSTNFRHISTKYKFRPTVHFDQTLYSTSCLIRPNVVFDEVSFDELSWIHYLIQ